MGIFFSAKLHTNYFQSTEELLNNLFSSGRVLGSAGGDDTCLALLGLSINVLVLTARFYWKQFPKPWTRWFWDCWVIIILVEFKFAVFSGFLFFGELVIVVYERFFGSGMRDCEVCAQSWVPCRESFNDL